MKRMKSLLMLAAIAVASLSIVSCDDDPWDGPHSWRDDPYGWYGDYGNWGWNNNYWNQGGNSGNQNDSRAKLARLLCGEWGGNFDYSYINEDGNSRTTESYYTTMKFFQYNQNSNSYSGEGVETDYLMDADGNPIDDANHKQVMEFSWYIESNGDIYIQYKTSSKSTFVLDYGSSQRGYFIGQEDDKNYDTFYGYMIGTGNVNGDVIKFDFARLNEISNAKALTRSAAGEVESYGKGATQKPLKSVPATRFNSRR